LSYPILIAFGLVGQQFPQHNLPVRTLDDDAGKGAAAIDPNLPAWDRKI